MRIAALIAVGLLVAGCTHAGSNHTEQTQTSTGAPTGASSSTSSTATSPSVSKPPAPSSASSAPAAGAAISTVVAWIEAAHAADPARYHDAARDGVTTPLGNVHS